VCHSNGNPTGNIIFKKEKVKELNYEKSPKGRFFGLTKFKLYFIIKIEEIVK